MRVDPSLLRHGRAAELRRRANGALLSCCDVLDGLCGGQAPKGDAAV